MYDQVQELHILIEKVEICRKEKTDVLAASLGAMIEDDPRLGEAQERYRVKKEKQISLFNSIVSVIAKLSALNDRLEYMEEIGHTLMDFIPPQQMEMLLECKNYLEARDFIRI